MQSFIGVRGIKNQVKRNLATKQPVEGSKVNR